VRQARLHHHFNGVQFENPCVTDRARLPTRINIGAGFPRGYQRNPPRGYACTRPIEAHDGFRDRQDPRSSLTRVAARREKAGDSLSGRSNYDESTFVIQRYRCCSFTSVRYSLGEVGFERAGARERLGKVRDDDYENESAREGEEVC